MSRQELVLWGELAEALLASWSTMITPTSSHLRKPCFWGSWSISDNDHRCTIGQKGKNTSLSDTSEAEKYSVRKDSDNFYQDSNVNETSESQSPLFYQALQGAKNSLELLSLSLNSPVQLSPVQREELAW